MMLGRYSGVARFVDQLVRNLSSDCGIEVLALCGESAYSPWEQMPFVTVVRSSFARRHRTPLRRLAWEARYLRRLAGAHQIDLFHATWNSGVPRGLKVPTILTVHDVIPIHHPREHFANTWDRIAYEYSLRSSAARATVVTTVSDHVCRQVIDLVRIDPNRVRRIHNGVEAPAPADNLELAGHAAADPPFVLYVGGHEPRKNVAGVFRAMRCYWQRRGGAIQIWLTGTRESLCARAANELEHTPATAGVRFLGDVSDAELAELYRKATALFMLSYDEGFGLPAAEAMAHGCPVIAANRGALPEIVGNAGCMVEPDDPQGAADTLARINSSSAFRTHLRHAGISQAGTFCWKRTAHEFLSLYKAVAGNAPAHLAADLLHCPPARGRPRTAAFSR